jgi:molybdopterin/thiamine biosynthesis adenylyltransferase
MIEVVFPDNLLGEMRASLLSASPDEAAAVLFASTSTGPDRQRLLVREWHGAAREDYSVQEPLRATLKPATVAKFLKKARLEGWSLLLAHTHPFADEHVAFSPLDDEGEQVLMPSLFGRAPDRLHGALVLGKDSALARIWSDPQERPPPPTTDRIVEVGRRVRAHARGQDRSLAVGPEHDRSVRAFGRDGQATLAALRVGIVGLGGLGSIVAEQLAHLGVRQMLLIDPDHVEPTNLNRVVGATRSSVGRSKVEVTGDLVRRIRPETGVETLAGDVTGSRCARSLVSADFVFCCTDSHGSRHVLNQLAYQHFVPTLDMGVRIDVRGERVERVTGRVQMLAPGLPCLVCQNLLDPAQVRRDLLAEDARAADPYIVGAARPDPQPAVISLNGTVASMAVSMMLAAVAGFPMEARHQVVVFDRGVTRAVSSSPVHDCVVCSRAGTFGRGDAGGILGRPE